MLVSKTEIGVSLSRVRISPCPPFSKLPYHRLSTQPLNNGAVAVEHKGRTTDCPTDAMTDERLSWWR